MSNHFSAENVLVKRPLMRLLSISLLTVAAGPVAAWAQVKIAPPIPGVIGKVVAVTSNSVEIQTKNGVVQVGTVQPLATYRQVPSDLSLVTTSSYEGIASVKQENGVGGANVDHDISEVLVRFPIAEALRAVGLK